MESGEERGREGGEEVGEVQIFLLLLNLLSEKDLTNLRSLSIFTPLASFQGVSLAPERQLRGRNLNLEIFLFLKYFLWCCKSNQVQFHPFLKIMYR